MMELEGKNALTQEQKNIISHKMELQTRHVLTEEQKAKLRER